MINRWGGIVLAIEKGNGYSGDLEQMNCNSQTKLLKLDLGFYCSVRVNRSSQQFHHNILLKLL